jgi:hypothetical protein
LLLETLGQMCSGARLVAMSSDTPEVRSWILVGEAAPGLENTLSGVCIGPRVLRQRGILQHVADLVIPLCLSRSRKRW